VNELRRRLQSQSASDAQTGMQLVSAQGYYATQNGVSGGTLATLFETLSSNDDAKQVRSTQLLTTPAALPAASDPQLLKIEKDHIFPRYDAEVSGYVIPFVMGMVNTRVVRRSAGLFKLSGNPNQKYGEQFAYNEAQHINKWYKAWLTWLGLAFFGHFNCNSSNTISFAHYDFFFH